jgi:HEPN domain-containing protein
MNKDKLNRAKIFFAQGEREIANAKNKLNDSNDGKVRTLARRAAGFYIDGLLEIKPRDHYGSSFINHLKALQNDHEVPINVREAANKLTNKVGVDDLTGVDSIMFAEIIIDYCKQNTNFD